MDVVGQDPRPSQRVGFGAAHALDHLLHLFQHFLTNFRPPLPVHADNVQIVPVDGVRRGPRLGEIHLGVPDLEALEQCLQSQGAKFTPGAGVAAANAVYTGK